LQIDERGETRTGPTLSGEREKGGKEGEKKMWKVPRGEGKDEAAQIVLSFLYLSIQKRKKRKKKGRRGGTQRGERLKGGKRKRGVISHFSLTNWKKDHENRKQPGRSYRGTEKKIQGLRRLCHSIYPSPCFYRW